MKKKGKKAYFTSQYVSIKSVADNLGELSRKIFTSQYVSIKSNYGTFWKSLQFILHPNMFLLNQLFIRHIPYPVGIFTSQYVSIKSKADLKFSSLEWSFTSQYVSIKSNVHLSIAHGVSFFTSQYVSIKSLFAVLPGMW